MVAIKDQIRKAFHKDGGDHVNINLRAETEIGRLCSPDWRKTFFIPHLGEFLSPRNFVYWVLSGGDEEQRHSFERYNTRSVPLGVVRDLLLYAKFYQVNAMIFRIQKQKELMDLPWVMYRKHLTGVKEYDTWEDYPSAVKEFVDFVQVNGRKAKFPWAEKHPRVLENVNIYVLKVIKSEVGEDIGSVESLDEIVQKEIQQKKEQQREFERRRAEKQKAYEERKAKAKAEKAKSDNHELKEFGETLDKEQTEQTQVGEAGVVDESVNDSNNEVVVEATQETVVEVEDQGSTN